MAADNACLANVGKAEATVVIHICRGTTKANGMSKSVTNPSPRSCSEAWVLTSPSLFKRGYTADSLTDKLSRALPGRLRILGASMLICG